MLDLVGFSLEAIRCSGSLFACTVALVVDAPSPRADHAFSGRIAKRRTAKRCWLLRRVLECCSRVRGSLDVLKLLHQGVFYRKQDCPALRKLERVGVAWNVAGIYFGWDSIDHFGNPAVYNWDLPLGFAQRRYGRDQHKLDGRVVATRPAHRTSC